MSSKEYDAAKAGGLRSVTPLQAQDVPAPTVEKPQVGERTHEGHIAIHPAKPLSDGRRDSISKSLHEVGDDRARMNRSNCSSFKATSNSSISITLPNPFKSLAKWAASLRRAKAETARGSESLGKSTSIPEQDIQKILAAGTDKAAVVKTLMNSSAGRKELERMSKDNFQIENFIFLNTFEQLKVATDPKERRRLFEDMRSLLEKNESNTSLLGSKEDYDKGAKPKIDDVPLERAGGKIKKSTEEYRAFLLEPVANYSDEQEFATKVTKLIYLQEQIIPEMGQNLKAPLQELQGKYSPKTTKAETAKPKDGSGSAGAEKVDCKALAKVLDPDNFKPVETVKVLMQSEEGQRGFKAICGDSHCPEIYEMALLLHELRSASTAELKLEVHKRLKNFISEDAIDPYLDLNSGDHGKANALKAELAKDAQRWQLNSSDHLNSLLENHERVLGKRLESMGFTSSCPSVEKLRQQFSEAVKE